MKKILLVDDSALMRRVLCDIIDSDSRFHVEDRATNGIDKLSREIIEAKCKAIFSSQIGEDDWEICIQL